ncbi:hypothetical protein H920_12250 [Fukomys damarensis]|uniref:Uncharacterized protein n=1 Tax=Fukomys damarensis TaxID=885580 RepID=A0A091D5N7_FUKDA|nr:hypothetical protein H920_12250 [Fukomys damarensis]
MAATWASHSKDGRRRAARATTSGLELGTRPAGHSSPYGIGVKQKGAAEESWLGSCSKSRATYCPQFLATDSVIVSESDDTLRSRCLYPHPSRLLRLVVIK